VADRCVSTPAEKLLISKAAKYREMDMRFWLEKVEAEVKECT